MTKYIKFKHFARGVPTTKRNSTTKYRNCTHCGARAYWTASRTGSLILEVLFCEDHVLVARAINERKKAS